MNIKNLTLFIALFFSCLTSYGDIPRWYQYEIIIFKYTSNSYTESESWPDKPGLPDYQNALALLTDKEENNPSSTTNFVLLKKDQLILKKEVQAIQRSSRRKLLLHTGWVQTMQSKDKTFPVSFKIGKEYTIMVPEPDATLTQNHTGPGNTTSSQTNPPAVIPAPRVDDTPGSSDPDQDTPAPTMIPLNVAELEGTISISIGRYLHVWTDFLFRRPNDNPTTFDDTPESITLNKFRYKDHRRMRSRELHYIDSPSFGILIYALPYKQIVENK